MRGGLSLVVAASFAAALASAACGSSEGSGDAPDAGETDAPAPLPDGEAGPDADAGGADATDAADAKKDAVSPPSGFCGKLVPTPKFCDDFDDGDLTDDWDANAVLAGTIDIDDSTSTSQPASFLAKTTALTMVGTGANASIRKTIFGTVTHAKLSFMALLPVVTFSQGIVAIATLDVSTSHYFTLNLRDQDAVPAASLEEFVGGTLTRHVLTKLPPAGTWTRVTIDLDLTAGKANLSFDAEKALDAEPIMAVPGTEATVRLGAVYMEGPVDAFTAHFDDVVLDF